MEIVLAIITETVKPMMGDEFGQGKASLRFANRRVGKVVISDDGPGVVVNNCTAAEVPVGRLVILANMPRDDDDDFFGEYLPMQA